MCPRSTRGWSQTAVASRPNVGLGVDVSWPNMGLTVDVSRSNMLLPPKKNHIVDLKDKIIIIICAINIIIFIIIEGINIKNTIICVINITISIIVQSINIKNIIIYGINIFIFIIIEDNNIYLCCISKY
jgi:hypothetical protein